MERAVKHFHRYTSEQRADMRASHRLGFRQRDSIGEAFWTHVLVPGIGFRTRKAAEAAAQEVLDSHRAAA